MATPYDANTIIQIVANGELYGQQILNVFHYEAQDASVDYKQSMNDLLEEMDSNGGFFNKMLLCLTEDYAIKSWNAQPVFPTRLAAVKRTNLTFVTGLDAPPALPSNVSAVITKNTDFTGRDAIGSVHLAGIGVDHQEDDEWAGTYKTTLGNFAPKLFEAVSIGGFAENFLPVLWSPNTPTFVIYLTAAQVQPTIRVERRRTKGVGR